MRTTPPRPQSSTRPVRRHHPALVAVWRWHIAAAAEPIPLNWALAVGDAVMDALTTTAYTLSGSGRLPVCLHGPNDANAIGWNHDHAFILSEDVDDDGIIDHITVSASAGLDPAAVRLLAATDRLTLSSGAQVELLLERAGGPEAADEVLRGPAHVWNSRSPYVAPARDRSSFDIRDAQRQLKHEIGKRMPSAILAAAPEPLDDLIHAGEPLRAEHFHIVQDNGGTPPQSARPCFFRLTFEHPVDGPLAFGWGCHRGLGLFVAEGVVNVRSR